MFDTMRKCVWVHRNFMEDGSAHRLGDHSTILPAGGCARCHLPLVHVSAHEHWRRWKSLWCLPVPATDKAVLPCPAHSRRCQSQPSIFEVAYLQKAMGWVSLVHEVTPRLCLRRILSQDPFKEAMHGTRSNVTDVTFTPTLHRDTSRITPATRRCCFAKLWAQPWLQEPAFGG